VDGGVYFLFGEIRLSPVEDPPLIGTGCDAIPAPDAPVVIDDHDPVRLLPCGMNGTDFDTGRIFTLLALNGKIDKALFRDRFRIIVMFRIFEVDHVPSLQLEDPDPMKLRIMPGLVVFLYTPIHTPPASDAPGKVESVTPESFREGLFRADLKFLPKSLEVSLLQFFNGLFFFSRRHLMKMLLQKVLGLFFGAGREQRHSGACQSG
jgi:hypothetical protein